MSVTARIQYLLFLAFLGFMLLLFPSVSAFSEGYRIDSGKKAILNQAMHVYSGPGTAYTDLGTYFESGTEISTLTATRDGNGRYWIQVQFHSQGALKRGYVSAQCLSIEPQSLPSENSLGQYTLTRDCDGLLGPGSGYASQNVSVSAGTVVTVFAFENGYALIECTAGHGRLVRTWVPRSVL